MCTSLSRNYQVLPLTQALVDGPNMKRRAVSFTKLSLTDYKLRISRSARQKQVKAKFEAADIVSQWEKTAWAQKIARKAKREQLTDFDRFKLRVLRQQVSLVKPEDVFLYSRKIT